MKKWSIFLFLVCLSVFFSTLGNSAQPKVTVKAKESSEIHVVAYDDPIGPLMMTKA